MQDTQNERQKAIEQIQALAEQYHIDAAEVGLALDTSVQSVSSETPVNSVAPGEPQIIGSVPVTDAKEIADAPPVEENKDEHLSVAEVFYNLGAWVLLSGVWALVAINWAGLGAFGKVASSLAIVAFTYFVAVGLSKIELLKKVAPALFLAVVLTIPVVLFAIYDAAEITLSIGHAAVIALISGVLSFAGWLIHRGREFMLGVIAYATTAYIMLIGKIVETLPSRSEVGDDIMVGSYVLLGSVYIVVAYLSKNYVKPVAQFKGALYAFGAIFILFSLFTQTGWSQNDPRIMDFVYPVVVIGLGVLSAVMKAPQILGVTSVFLILYIIKTTFTYFSSNIGWPMALVISGFCAITVGVAASVLAKKIQNTNEK